MMMMHAIARAQTQRSRRRCRCRRRCRHALMGFAPLSLVGRIARTIVWRSSEMCSRTRTPGVYVASSRADRKVLTLSSAQNVLFVAACARCGFSGVQIAVCYWRGTWPCTNSVRITREEASYSQMNRFMIRIMHCLCTECTTPTTAILWDVSDAMHASLHWQAFNSRIQHKSERLLSRLVCVCVCILRVDILKDVAASPTLSGDGRAVFLKNDCAAECVDVCERVWHNDAVRVLLTPCTFY